MRTRERVEVQDMLPGWQWEYVAGNGAGVCRSSLGWGEKYRRECIRSAKNFAKKLGCKVVDESGTEL